MSKYPLTPRGLLELSNNKTANVLGATDAEISRAIEDAVTIPCETGVNDQNDDYQKYK